MAGFQDKRLYKVSDKAQVFGVCAGLAEYFNVDVTLVRLLMVALAFAGGSGVVFYIIAAIVMPDKKHLDLDPKK